MPTPTITDPLLDPKIDLVFKKLFAGAPELLADLIKDCAAMSHPLQ